MTSKRLFSPSWLAAALVLTACGKDTPTRPNTAPTATAAILPAGPVLMGATRVSFQASATDLDGDVLTYAWQFGDGAIATGRSVTHVYGVEGTFAVTLEASDGRGGTATVAAGSVTVRSLNGLWVGDDQTFEFSQQGDMVTGRRVVRGSVGPLQGTVADVRFLTFHAEFIRNSFGGGFCPITYRGDLDLDMNEVVGTQTIQAGCGFGGGQSFLLVLRRR